MILVTGTKRSGTSLWMQVLIRAGLPYIGQEFPANWGASIRPANPRGFWESRLREGIFYRTNPDPETGKYLRPDATRRHAVKVFIPGLIRTDSAFIDRVVATMRHWRSYAASMRHLHALEDQHLAATATSDEVKRVMASRGARRASMPYEVEWFLENYDLIRDVAARRYPINLVTYERFVTDPTSVLASVMPWLGVEEPEVGLHHAVDAGLHRSLPSEDPPPPGLLPNHATRVFDQFHDEVHRTSRISPALASDLNEMWSHLVERFGQLGSERQSREPPPGS